MQATVQSTWYSNHCAWDSIDGVCRVQETSLQDSQRWCVLVVCRHRRRMCIPHYVSDVMCCIRMHSVTSELVCHHCIWMLTCCRECGLQYETWTCMHFHRLFCRAVSASIACTAALAFIACTVTVTSIACTIASTLTVAIEPIRCTRSECTRIVIYKF